MARCAGMRQRPSRGGPLQGTGTAIGGSNQGSPDAPLVAGPVARAVKPLSLVGTAPKVRSTHRNLRTEPAARVPFPSQAPGTPSDPFSIHRLWMKVWTVRVEWAAYDHDGA